METGFSGGFSLNGARGWALVYRGHVPRGGERDQGSLRCPRRRAGRGTGLPAWCRPDMGPALSPAGTVAPAPSWSVQPASPSLQLPPTVPTWTPLGPQPPLFFLESPATPSAWSPPPATSLPHGGGAALVLASGSPVLRRRFPHGAAPFSPSPLLPALFSAPLVPSPDGTSIITPNQPQMRPMHPHESAGPRAAEARAPTTRPIYKQFSLRRLSYICPNSCFIFLSKRHSLPICLAGR